MDKIWTQRQAYDTYRLMKGFHGKTGRMETKHHAVRARWSTGDMRSDQRGLFRTKDGLLRRDLASVADARKR